MTLLIPLLLRLTTLFERGVTIEERAAKADPVSEEAPVISAEKE